MLLTTGARAEELMRLKMEDVDLSRRTVLLKGKGDRQQAIKERVVTLTPNAVQALLRWMNHRGRILTIAPELREHLWLSYVVPHKRWCPMTVNALKHMLADLGRNAGITDRRVSAHTFRHTFGTWMWIEETPLPQLQYMMGHKDIRSTMVYVRCGAEIAGRMEQKQRDPFRMWF
jgi:integrase